MAESLSEAEGGGHAPHALITRTPFSRRVRPYGQFSFHEHAAVESHHVLEVWKLIGSSACDVEEYAAVELHHVLEGE